MVGMTRNPPTHNAAPETTMIEKMHMTGDIARPRQRTRKRRSRWRITVRMTAEQTVELAIIVINLRVNVSRS